ncbi:CpaF family protein [Kitasatospora sp. NPDC001540]|uniref:CpaF family protein n=1 Tax=Kitasatospora sp. NPDC001540 TaxID=3364014 RepID=UPI0036B3564B
MSDGTDFRQVALLHSGVADRLAEDQRERARRGELPMSDEVESQFARSLIKQELDKYNGERADAGLPLLTPDEEKRLADAVHDRIYAAGSLSPHLRDPDLENLDFQGCDQVFGTYRGGIRRALPPLAESDEELIGLLQTAAAAAGTNGRSFDPANPMLDATLYDGSRLSAVYGSGDSRRLAAGGVTKRPSGSIRLNRLGGAVFLDDLVKFGSLTDEAAAFLRALVLARKNIVIGGATDSGKTTMLRALANVIPPHERLLIVEKALELHLDAYPELHPNVLPLEERLPNSEGLGAVTMAELVRRSLRSNPDRVIVGEVLGPEALDMLNAMGQGNDGSLSTIHARTSAGVLDRISTYARQGAPTFDRETINMMIAGALDFVVYLGKVDDPATGGWRRRVISIREITGEDGRVLSNEVFKLDPAGALRPAAPVTCLEELERFGYLPSGDFV